MKEKVLVTGGSGFVGMALINKLKDNYDVISFDKNGCDGVTNVTWHLGSVNNLPDLISTFKGVDYVIHLAAVANYKKMYDNPEEGLTTNILGTMNVLEACKACKVKKIIFASSMYVFTDNNDLYNLSKKIGEALVQHFCKKNNMNFAIARLGTVYGRGNRGEDVVSIFLEEAKKNGTITIEGVGTQERNFINVSDVIDALEKIIHNNKLNIWEVYDKPIQIITLVQSLSKYFKGFNIVFAEPRLNEVRASWGFIETHKMLEWSPRITFDAYFNKEAKVA